jgi:predicted amidophosphoribosyltransferase
VQDLVRTWLFPPACVACDAPGPALCATCAPGERDTIAFEIEGIPAFALGRYDGALRRAVVAMKNGRRDPLDAFAGLLAARAPLAGVLVGIPTSRGRVLDRGFDQGAELARKLAALRAKRCAELLAKRGNAQAGLGRRARLAAAGRFRMRDGVPVPPVVTLVDDVCTTGATARDAVHAVQACGGHVSGIVVVARTER